MAGAPDPGRRQMLGILGGLAVSGGLGLGIGAKFRDELRELRDRVTGGPATPRRPDPKAAFVERATAIKTRHRAQTLADVRALKARFAEPVFGRLDPWEAIQRLALVSDPIDRKLFGASQWYHTAQTVAAMEAEGMDEPDFVLMALLHDVGKLALLTGEAPENVLGQARLAKGGGGEEGAGLFGTTLLFSHPELMYMRVREQVPEHVAWTIRHHNIRLRECEPFMDARDREWLEAYLKPFRRFDQGSKDLYEFPEFDQARCRALLEETFPDGLVL